MDSIVNEHAAKISLLLQEPYSVGESSGINSSSQSDASQAHPQYRIVQGPIILSRPNPLKCRQSANPLLVNATVSLEMRIQNSTAEY